MLLFLSLLLALAGNTSYHLCQKLVPTTIGPCHAVVLMYGVSFLGALLASYLIPGEHSWGSTLKETNWAVLGVGCSALLIEIGILLAYRNGALLSSTSLIINATTTLLLFPVGLMLFQETLSIKQMVGMVCTLVGLYLIK